MFSASSATASSSTTTAEPRRTRGIARLAASVVASGLVVAGALTGAGGAVADEAPPHQGGATATLDGLKTFDSAVLHAPDGKNQKLPAGLFEMTVDGGGKFKTYCIDIHNPTQDQAKYLETPWNQTSLGTNKNAGKIRWILEHSYPKIDDLQALAEEAGTGPLTERTAAAGTQVAIWRYSDSADVTASDGQAEKLADWLQKSATDTAEPRASLALDPVAVSGNSGKRLGPVTVRTNAGQVSVNPPADSASGIRITDKKGKAVTTATNGSQLYFDIPAGAADGSASLTVQATTSVPVGRAFAGATKSQTQILAGSSESTVSASATATWAGKGAIPAVTAKKNCANGGVDVTTSNTGDEAFTYELAGAQHTVAPGKSETVTVPVAEDQAYDVTVTGPGGFSRTFKGVLDCKTTGSGTDGLTTQTAEQPTTTTATAGGNTAGAGAEGNLAETGSSNATPMIAGIAIALVVIGGGSVFLLRRRKDQSSGE